MFISDARILIIEDDSIIKTELKTFLERYCYEVLIVEDLKDILSLVMENKPQLVLLDINLPVYDGFHICKEIRKISKIPIIIVTSRDSDVDEIMSMNLGADDFITKPYNTQILLARISALMQRVYNNEKSNLLNFAGLTLDIGKGIVTHEGKSIELTKNEGRILSLLLAKKGEIVSRNDIMNELWQSNEFVDDNTLTVNINRVRNRLNEIGAINLLKTNRGQGYSICKQESS